jgi:hypothetical protein
LTGRLTDKTSQLTNQTSRVADLTHFQFAHIQKSDFKPKTGRRFRWPNWFCNHVAP